MAPRDELRPLRQLGWNITEKTTMRLVPRGTTIFEVSMRDPSNSFLTGEKERIELCKELMVSGVLYIFGYGPKTNTLAFRRVDKKHR